MQMAGKNHRKFENSGKKRSGMHFQTRFQINHSSDHISDYEQQLIHLASLLQVPFHKLFKQTEKKLA